MWYWNDLMRLFQTDGWRHVLEIFIFWIYTDTWRSRPREQIKFGNKNSKSMWWEMLRMRVEKEFSKFDFQLFKSRDVRTSTQHFGLYMGTGNRSAPAAAAQWYRYWYPISLIGGGMQWNPPPLGGSTFPLFIFFSNENDVIDTCLLVAYRRAT